MSWRSFRLVPGRILDEQLRLLLGNQASSELAAISLATVLAWRMTQSVQLKTVLFWWLVTSVSSVVSWLHSSCYLRHGWDARQAPRIVWQRCLIDVIVSCPWGSLPLLCFGVHDSQLEIIAIATITGLAVHTVGQNAPIPHVFLRASLFLLSCLGFLIQPDDTIRILGVGALLLIPAFTIQALNGAKVVRNTVQLTIDKDTLIQAAETARRDAVKANAAKSVFLAAASHDLRQPIHAQALFLEALSATRLDGSQSDLLANARLAGSASSELLDALLDFSRIEAGVVVPCIRSFSIQDIFYTIENEAAPMAEAKGLIFRCHESTLAAYSDPALVELILRNLTSNAIRYTFEGGVLLGARQRTGLLVVEVWDTGLGIEPEQQEAIFQEFHQLNNPARDRRKGLGLGLAIAKGLADRLGHKLTLRSRPGHGSVFRLEIPVYTGVIAAVNLPDSSKISLIGKKALVLDDDPLALQSMGSLLQSWGMACELASAVDEAVGKSKHCRPDIIITDYRLSEERTGAQAIALVRLELGEQMPALIVTGDTSPQRLREASASGVPLLHKPANPDDVRRLISQALAQNFTD